MSQPKTGIRLYIVTAGVFAVGLTCMYQWFQRVSDPPYIPIFVCDPSDPTDTKECLAMADGICARGLRLCHRSGRYWLDQCEPIVLPEDREEICDNGQDDNCDGWLDEVGCRPQIRVIDIEQLADPEVFWSEAEDNGWWMVDLEEERLHVRQPLGCEPHERACRGFWRSALVSAVYWLPELFEEDPLPYEGGYRYAGRLWEGDRLRAGEIGLFCTRDVVLDATLCEYHVCDAPDDCLAHECLLDSYTVVTDAYIIADGRWIDHPPVPEIFFRSQM